MKLPWLPSIFLMVVLQSCTQHQTSGDKPLKVRVPPWFEQPDYPPDNIPTTYRVELGRRLFYNPGLSSDGRTSCGTCHVPSSAFTDGQKVSEGAHGRQGKRNAPTLENLAWMPYFMMEGGVPTLEMQSLAPLSDTNEMNRNVLELASELKSDPTLNKLSLLAYGRDLDVYVITRALACFQRTFVSGDSHYDRFVFLDQKDQMSASQQRGMDLFFSGRTSCSSCHSGVLFTDYHFYNIGLYRHYADTGLERVTYSPQDSGKFKTPSLRNCALTAPYMHDGSLESLQEVISFYNRGGALHPAKDSLIRPLGLTAREERDLVAFLLSLTDWNFVQNTSFLPLD
jgi:cytochrome c peroxidase